MGEDAIPTGAGRAEDRHISILAQLLQQARIVGKGLGIDQPFAIEFVQILQALLPLWLGKGGLDRAIFQVEVAGAVGRYPVIVDEGIHDKAVQLGAPAAVHLGGAGERNLIGFAIAVRVLLFEGFQHLVKFFGGRRHSQAQFVEPRLVDPHLLRHAAMVAVVDMGQAIDLAVEHGDQIFDLRVGFVDLFEFDAILFDVVIERQQQPLVRQNLHLIQADAAADDHFRQVAAG